MRLARVRRPPVASPRNQALFLSRLSGDTKRPGSTARGIRLGNGIQPGAAPRRATCEAFDREPQPAPRAMDGQGLGAVMGARRLVPATAADRIENPEQRGQQHLVPADEQAQHSVDHGVEPGAGASAEGKSIEARSANRNHSSLSSAAVARAARCRAITTSQPPARNRDRLARIASRRRRRTRLRATAPPTRRDVTNPMRQSRPGSASRSTPRTMKRPPNDRP